MMLEIQYRETKNNGIEILRCFGSDGSIHLPDEIDQKPVVKIGDYAFSSHKRKEEEAKSIRIGEDFFKDQNQKMLCGNLVKEVFLPKYAEEIGKYAFYGCVNLELLGFSEALVRTGTGIFTGCKLKKVKVDRYQKKRTALRDIVMDTRFPLSVEIRDHENGDKAVLFFPEYYEESVENTPARIVELHFHGTGYQYRQCFIRGELDYQKYDELFETAVVQEEPETVWNIALGRVGHPYQLTEENKQHYLNYMKEHQEEILDRLFDQENLEVFRLFSEENIWAKEVMERAIDRAAIKEKTEILSFLMDERNKRFLNRKKTFDL